MSETVCPLCQAPRPRGAKRCLCNYTFEYEPPRRAGALARRPGMAPLLVGLAVVAAAVAGVLARGVEHPPDDAVVPAVMIGAGLFSLLGAHGGWSWFLGNRRARKFVWLLGATGARGFYALLGGALAGGGIGFLV